MEDVKKGRITPEKTIAILKENGIEVSYEEAKLILAFLFRLAETAVKQYNRNAHGDG